MAGCQPELNFLPYTILHDPEYDAVALIHTGQVSAAEIRASRIDLAESVLQNRCRGAMINILDAHIEAEPPEIVDHVHALIAGLTDGTRLAFVSREIDQIGVALVVESVADMSPVGVRRFGEVETAWVWLAYGDTVLPAREG